MKKRFLTWALATVFAILIMTLFCGCANPVGPSTGDSFTFIGANEQQQGLAIELWKEQKVCMCFGRDISVTVEVKPGGFFCGTVYAAGCTHPGRIQVSGEERYYEGALSHEYIHLVDFEEGRAPDYNHSGPQWAKCDKRNRP